MDLLIVFVLGAVVASVGWFLVARNNKKHFTDLLDLDPREGWDEIIKKIREKF